MIVYSAVYNPVYSPVNGPFPLLRKRSDQDPFTGRLARPPASEE
jgi:hypothetical protein